MGETRNNRILQSFQRGVAAVDERGLRIGSTMQVFAFERHAQTRFARFVRRRADRIINVGLGMGFAQSAFRGFENQTLVEINASLITKLSRRLGLSAVDVYAGSWQDFVGEKKGQLSRATFYFDAFPLDPRFSYDASSFRIYLRPFLHWLGSADPSIDAYFIAFDRSPITFTLRGLRVHRVMSVPAPIAFQNERWKFVSLYRAKRFFPATT